VISDRAASSVAARAHPDRAARGRGVGLPPMTAPLRPLTLGEVCQENKGDDLARAKLTFRCLKQVDS